MLIDVGDTRLHVTERGAGRVGALRPARRPRARPHDVRLLPRRARRSLPPAAGRRARHRALGALGAGDLGARPTTPPTSRRWPARSGSSATRSSGTPTGRSSRCSTRSTSRAAGRHDRLERHPRRALPRPRRGGARRLRARRAARAGAAVVGARRPTRARRRRSPRCSPTSSRSTSPTRATRASTNCAPPWATRSTGPTCCARPRPRTTARSRSRTASPTSPTRCSCSPGATTAPARWRRPRRWRPACPTRSSSSSSTAAT